MHKPLRAETMARLNSLILLPHRYNGLKIILVDGVTALHEATGSRPVIAVQGLSLTLFRTASSVPLSGKQRFRPAPAFSGSTGLPPLVLQHVACGG